MVGTFALALWLGLFSPEIVLVIALILWLRLFSPQFWLRGWDRSALTLWLGLFSPELVFGTCALVAG